MSARTTNSKRTSTLARRSRGKIVQRGRGRATDPGGRHHRDREASSASAFPRDCRRAGGRLYLSNDEEQSGQETNLETSHSFTPLARATERREASITSAMKA